MTIHKANVNDVDEIGFEDKLNEQGKQLKELKEDKDKMERVIKELEASKKKMEAERIEEEKKRKEEMEKQMQEFKNLQLKIKKKNKEKPAGTVAHGVSCRVTVEYLQQSLRKASEYKKVISSSSSFQSSYKKVDSAISMSGSGGMPGIFDLSSKMASSFKKVVDESSSQSNYRYEEKSEETEYNTDFLQLLRKVSTVVAIDGSTVEMIETMIVDSIPTASPLTSKQLEEKSKEFIMQEYDNGEGSEMTFGPRCTFYYSDQLFVEEEKVEEKKEPEWYYIRGVESGLYLDHSGYGKVGKSGGNPITLANKSGHDCQLWKHTEDKYIMNKLGYVMDIAQGKKHNGAGVDGWYPTNTIKQKWYIEGDSICSYMNHKVLDVAHKRKHPGAVITVYTNYRIPNQLFNWIPAE